MEENVKAGAMPNEFEWPLAPLRVLKDRAVGALFASRRGAVEGVAKMRQSAAGGRRARQ